MKFGHFGWVTILGGLMLLLSRPAPIQAQNDLAPRVKAAVIYKIALFTTWPNATLEAAGDRILVGVIGRDALSQSLGSIAGKSVNRRTVEIVSLGPGDDPGNVHILYVAGSEKSRYRSILKKVEGSPVLTVGDGTDFVSAGGMIGLHVEGENVRFEICAPCASEGGLKLSANLLQLARLRTP